MVACREGKYNIVNHYITDYPKTKEVPHFYHINDKMKDGWTPLMYACVNGFLKIVQLILENTDARINLTDRLHRNPLHWACRWNNVKLAQILLEHKV